MTVLAVPSAASSSLRQRLIDDMTRRRFSQETQRNYIRDVGLLATLQNGVSGDRLLSSPAIF